MSVSLTRTMARFVGDMSFDKLPRAVVDKVKTCLLDAIACSCGGFNLPWSRAADKMALAQGGGAAEATLWIDGTKVSYGYAALANAAVCHSIIQEDMHAETAAHFGSVVIPAAVALGETLGSSGRDVITAIVAGYECMGRIGKSMVSPEFSKRGFRPSGSFGPFGSAAVGARLRGLTENQTTTSFGLAANLASGVNEWANAGTSDIFFHNGFASHNGLMAAYLAQNGVTAPEWIVEGKAGLANAWCGGEGDMAWALSDLGQVFEIERVYHKPAPACAFTQETVQAAQKLIAQYPIVPEDVESITISAYPMVKIYTGCDYAGPFTSLVQAQMSNQFAVASVVVHKDVSFKHYNDFANPAVNALAGRISVEIDPAAAAAFPDRKQSRITVKTKSGKLYVSEQKDLVHLGHEDIVSKLNMLGGDYFTEDRLQAIVGTLAQLDELKTLSELVGLLKRNKG